MKRLLIHNNNTSLSNIELFLLSEQFVFELDLDKDVDFYINENLTDGLLKQKLENCDIVFIKVSLSENYLEYLGLRLAYHIRLTKSLGEKCKIPIVLIAEESFQFLVTTSSEPSILSTKSIYLIKESLDEYQEIIDLFSLGKINPLDDYESFVGSLKINPPDNYSPQHSIANEWALARYTSMLEKDNENTLYLALQNKISELEYIKTLHFKHLESKTNRQKAVLKKNSIDPIIKEIEGSNIGIIEDEINKGWFEFYDYILQKSNATAIFYRDFKKNYTKTELIEKIKYWLSTLINSPQPIDVFIIDLRLHEDDFLEKDIDYLSGIQIIKFIRTLNPGIQIIISTASNKVWNFQKCLDLGVKHFAIKEAPELFYSRSETIKSFNNLKDSISTAVSDSFLANIYRRINALKISNLPPKSTLKDEKEFINLTFGKNGLFDQILELFLLGKINDAILNQCLLLSFQIIENYCNLSSIGDFGKDKKGLSSGYVWLKDSSKLQVFITDQDILLTMFELISGHFQFQNAHANKTPMSFKIFNILEPKSRFSSGLDATSLIKMISVLHFREGIENHIIEKLIKLRYYRSNVAAHLTGNIKADYKIEVTEIIFLISFFETLFD